jgi:hypothetical protein
MTRQNIFTTPLWRIEGAPQQLIDELYQGAYKFKELYSDNPNRSNEGGYQTPFLDWKEFHPQGIEYIEKVVGDIFKFKVNEWWYNINPKGAWNTPHTHPDCDFALVLYLTDSDRLLQLQNPFPQRKNTGGDHIGINANKGDIIIFPSDLVHYVKPNQREEDRISISMNLRLL